MHVLHRHRIAATLWLAVLVAIGAGVLPGVHRAQHAMHTAQTGQADAPCDLCAATLAAPLPVLPVVVAPVEGVVVERTVVVIPASGEVVAARGRAPPEA